MFCKNCGKEIKDYSKFCCYCGANLNQTNFVTPTPVQNKGSSSPRSRGVALILCVLGFCFVAGIHHFYVGKIGLGILWLLTGGLFGIGTIIDTILIATGEFKDKEGRVLDNWNFD